MADRPNTYTYCGGDPVNRTDPMGTDWIWQSAWLPSEGQWTEIPGTPRIPRPAFEGEDGQIWSQASYQLQGGTLKIGYHGSPGADQSFAQIGGELFVPEGDIVYLDDVGTWDFERTKLRIADEDELFEFYSHVLNEYRNESGINASTAMILGSQGYGVDAAAIEMSHGHLAMRGDFGYAGRAAIVGVATWATVEVGKRALVKAIPFIGRLVDKAKVGSKRAALAARIEARSAKRALMAPGVGAVDGTGFEGAVAKVGKSAGSSLMTRAHAQKRLIMSMGPSPYGNNSAAHHIFDFVEHDSPMGKRLKGWDIDLNSADNGVWLPTESIAGVWASIHRGRSTNQYKDYVLDQLKTAKNRQQALGVLESIRQELLDGVLKINGAK